MNLKQVIQIRNPKHEIRNKFKSPKCEIQNDGLMIHEFPKQLVKEDEYCFEHLIFEFWICFETGDPPSGWGVRRTNFDIRYSDLMHYLLHYNMTLFTASGGRLLDGDNLSGARGGTTCLGHGFRNVHGTLGTAADEDSRTACV